MEDTAEAFAKRLEAARVRAGEPSYRRLAAEMQAQHCSFAISNNSIGDYHLGARRKGRPVQYRQLDLVKTPVVEWLARRYRVNIEDLSPTVALRARDEELMLARTRWDSVLAGETGHGPPFTDPISVAA